jgi:hypothetical protein
VIAAPTGRAPLPCEVLVDCADIISEAPSGSIERSVLHGAYRVALVFADPSERLQAIAELSERALGRGIAAQDFNVTAASGLEIAGRRRA